MLREDCNGQSITPLQGTQLRQTRATLHSPCTLSPKDAVTEMHPYLREIFSKFKKTQNPPSLCSHMEAGVPTLVPMKADTSRHYFPIKQHRRHHAPSPPALPGGCWGPTSPSPPSVLCRPHGSQSCCQTQLSPPLTPPSCSWRLWHFPLQHFQSPAAPQPSQLQRSPRLCQH